MPRYSYVCQKCLHEIELIRRVDDRDKTLMCCEPGCDGHQEMTRLLNAAALIFKGAGWTPRSHHTGE